MKKQKIFFIIVVTFFIIPFAGKADNSTSSPLSASSSPENLGTLATSTPEALEASASTTTLGLQAPVIPEIITQINNAKALLAGVVLNHQVAAVYKNLKNSARGGSASGGKKAGKKTKVISSYTITNKDIALAISDPSTGNVITTIGRLSGTNMVFPDPDVSVKMTYFNGVNSRFSVSKPAGGIVLALKYLISSTDSGSKAAIENGLSEALYVPYSQNLDTPEVTAYGQSYLNTIINTVAGQLQNFPSSAIPGKTVTQAVPPAMIKALIYAEHTDTSAVLNGSAQSALNQMNILLALNGPDTYKYSVSNDGYSSRGIAQFVGSTYESLVKRHPTAGLNTDFVSAMQDHVTSIKAMYLLLDDYAGDVRIKSGNSFLPSRVFDYAAASYNGGTTRVAKAVAEFGDSWNQDRSGQINSLSAQVTSDGLQARSLRAKIKKTSDKKTKASLQSQLANAEASAASASSQLSAMQDATLRNTTVNYLAKIYKVVQYFNAQQIS